jgi:hypothetical protein
MKLLLMAGLMSAFMAYRSFFSAGLDGSTWQVRIRPKTLFAFSSKDTLVFDQGQFTSSQQLTKGYLPAGYDYRAHNTKLGRFEASLVRDDGSIMDWVGEVRGEQVEGTVIWTRGRKTRRYNFRGKRRGKPNAFPFERRLSSMWRRLRFRHL